LHEGGFLQRNPARLIRRAVCGTPPPRALSEEDSGRLLSTLSAATSPEGQRDHALFHLMLGTGIRLGSAVALDVEDADLDRGELFLNTMKNSLPDKVFLGREICQHLREFIGSRISGPLFRGRAGERIWNLQRLYNLREGERRKDSIFPKRFCKDPLPEGPAKGMVVDAEKVDRMLDDYYEARGWNREEGIPTPEKMAELGLEKDFTDLDLADVQQTDQVLAKSL